MRSRKYKAWDPELKRWSTGFLGISPSGNYLFRSPYSSETYISFVPEKSRCTIVELTGLYDVDGNEIYEGDIIYSRKDVTSSLKLGIPSIVEYTTALARFTFYWGHYLSEKGVNRHKIQVVGNIFENGNLMGAIMNWHHGHDVEENYYEAIKLAESKYATAN